MNRLAIALIGVGCAAAALSCPAESACPAAVRPRIEVGAGQLTLADLLEPNACPRLRRLAAQVSLGTAPRAGRERVLGGRQIGRLIDALADRASSDRALADAAPRRSKNKDDQDQTDRTKENANENDDEKANGGGQRIPERIVVRGRGATKSCAEIAEFLGSGSASQALDCAAARSVPEDASLELWKTDWNARLQRREFTLRCLRPEDCVPFLVWDHAPPPSASAAGAASAQLASDGSNAARLVKRGQTATLTWEQGGIRVVLPVTCLEAGGLGQLVRVRFPNAGRTLQAEVIGEGTLRVRL
jgi:hypothetical protein